MWVTPVIGNERVNGGRIQRQCNVGGTKGTEGSIPGVTEGPKTSHAG